MKCEICGKEAENLVGCCRCGQLICLACEAAKPDDEDNDEVVCEKCF